MRSGWIRGKPVEFVDCVSQPLEVPAQAEIVLEGTVDPNERFLEGPLGDHTGCYTPIEPFPVSLLTALARRSEAIHPPPVVGMPPLEDVRMGRATERLLLPLIRHFLLEIADSTCRPRACSTPWSPSRSATRPKPGGTSTCFGDWSRDTVISQGPVDQLHHALPNPLIGGKIGLDAAGKLPEEGYEHRWPQRLEMTPEVKARVDAIWHQLGL